MTDEGLSGILRSLTNVVIRPWCPTDSAALAELFLRSFRHAYNNTAVRLVHPDDEVREWMISHLPESAVVCVAEVAGRVPVGYAELGAGWLHHLYVEPAWIRRGIGSALLRAAMASEPKGFDLWTFVANTPAQNFYLGHGLVEMERTDGAGNQERQPDIRFRWNGSVG